MNPEMLESSFKAHYIAAFLGAMAVSEYVRNCQNGWVEECKPQPVEDAKELAHEAWDQLKEAGIVA